MMEEAGRGISGSESHVERFDRQARLEMVGKRPTDHGARKGVENEAR